MVIELQTVGEYVNAHRYVRIWLCPDIVSDGRIKRNPLWQGIDCTPSTIPEELLNKKVTRTFNDCGSHCIIWKNEENIPFITWGDSILGQNKEVKDDSEMRNY